MSLRKDAFSWGLIALIGALIVVAALFVAQPYLRPHVSLHLGDGIFNAQLARTDTERQKGLSGVTHLGETDAMLFVYKQDGKPGIWMKDMNIPIDIIWLNADKKVVYIVKNVSPDTYPKVFLPKETARYVVEVAAGTVDKQAISVDREATFDLNEIQGVQL